MTPELLTALGLVAIPALASIIVGFWNRKKLNEIHIQFNSRTSELLDMTRQAALAEGKLIGMVDAAMVKTMIDEAIAQAKKEPPPSG